MMRASTIKIIKHLFIALVLFISSDAFAGEWIAVDGGVVEIKIDSLSIENDLWAYIHNNSAIKFEPRNTYVYQYLAISNSEILINALCRVDAKKSLHSEFVIVFDGGSCYFQVNYNFKTGTFSKLYVNGEA